MGYEDEDPFDVVMFGYHRDQVDEYLRIQTEQEQTVLEQSRRFADLERRLADALTENTKLRGSVARLTEDLALNQPTVGLSTRMQEMLRLAEQEAAAVRGEAASYADQIRRQAREDANLAASQRRHGEALSLGKPANVKETVGKSINGSKTRLRA